MRVLRSLIILLCVAALFPSATFGQELPKIGVGAKVSTLGIGFEAATAVTALSNVRGGFNFFNYDTTTSKDGIHYAGALRLRSIQFTYDQYLYHGFHVSTGLLVYNGNRAEANASVPATSSFSLGDVTYFSNQSDPVTGSAAFKLRKVAPMVLFGVGNLLPRNSRHIGFNADFGIVFQGSPDMKLNLDGTACVAGPTSGCVDTATDPTVLSNIQLEQDKINNDLKPLNYYPVLSVGISWKF